MNWFKRRSSGPQIVLKIPNLRCAHCEVAVKSALRRIDGVQQVKASFVRKQAVITVDPQNRPAVSTLTAALSAQGYHAELMTDS